jgi:hypothetical protein
MSAALRRYALARRRLRHESGSDYGVRQMCPGVILGIVSLVAHRKRSRRAQWLTNHKGPVWARS